MAVGSIIWSSQILGKQTTLRFILPQNGRPPYPVLYLLHGLSDDSSAWLRWTRLENHVAPWPLIVVMPDGYRGFYTDNEEGPAYAQHIGRELVDFVDGFLPTRAERSGRAIGGLSMGGYGALRIALGFPDRFCSAHSHSGAVGEGHVNHGATDPRKSSRQRAREDAMRAELRRIFGERSHGTAHDLRWLMRRARRRRLLPALRLDCGTEDFLLEDNRRFHAALQRARVPHLYEEHPGQHNWEYWDLHIRSAIAFHARQLGVAQAGA